MTGRGRASLRRSETEAGGPGAGVHWARSAWWRLWLGAVAPAWLSVAVRASQPCRNATREKHAVTASVAGNKTVSLHRPASRDCQKNPKRVRTRIQGEE